MVDEHGAVESDRELRKRRHGGIGRRQGFDPVGHHLLPELALRGERKAQAGEHLRVFRAEAEDRPGRFVAGGEDVRQLVRRRLAELRAVDRRDVGGGTAAMHLVDHVGRVSLAGEIVVPPHATVGRRLPGLAGETAAVHQRERAALSDIGGDLIAHVHLVDRHGADGSVARARRQGFGLHIATADEEAALLLEHERRQSRLLRQRG